MNGQLSNLSVDNSISHQLSIYIHVEKERVPYHSNKQPCTAHKPWPTRVFYYRYSRLYPHHNNQSKCFSIASPPRAQSLAGRALERHCSLGCLFLRRHRSRWRCHFVRRDALQCVVSLPSMLPFCLSEAIGRLEETGWCYRDKEELSGADFYFSYR